MSLSSAAKDSTFERRPSGENRIGPHSQYAAIVLLSMALNMSTIFDDFDSPP